jgi:hypothetical protein
MAGGKLMEHPYYFAWGWTPDPLYPYRGPLITSDIDLCGGPFRNKRAAFRINIGNEGWNFVVGGDPNNRGAALSLRTANHILDNEFNR